MRIPFLLKKADDQVELFHKLMTDASAQNKFFKEQLPKFKAALAERFNIDTNSGIKNIYSVDDVYNTSVIRFYDAIQRRRLYEEGGVLYYKDRQGNVSELNGTLGNFLQSIGKNVFQEILRSEAHLTDDSVDVSAADEIIDDDIDHINKTRIEIIWHILSKLDGHCKAILKEFLCRDVTRRKDKDIALLLGYKSEDVVKTQRNRCMKGFKNLVAQKIEEYGG